MWAPPPPPMWAPPPPPNRAPPPGEIGIARPPPPKFAGAERITGADGRHAGPDGIVGAELPGNEPDRITGAGLLGSVGRADGRFGPSCAPVIAALFPPPGVICTAPACVGGVIWIARPPPALPAPLFAPRAGVVFAPPI